MIPECKEEEFNYAPAKMQLQSPRVGLRNRTGTITPGFSGQRTPAGNKKLLGDNVVSKLLQGKDPNDFADKENWSKSSDSDSKDGGLAFGAMNSSFCAQPGQARTSMLGSS